MQRPPSLTLRLTVLFCAVATVVFFSFGWIIERSLVDHFVSEDISELNVIANAVEQTLAKLPPNDNLETIEQRLGDILVGHHGASMQITDFTGVHLYTSPATDFSSIPRPDTTRFTNGIVQQWHEGEHSYRLLIKSMVEDDAKPETPYTVTIAVATDYHLNFLSTFRHTLWLMVASGIAITGLMGWFVVKQGHRPLHRIVSQIRQISADDLDARLAPESVPAELTELAKSFNELLQRLEEAFTRLSNFSGDLAHELRTPITNLMTQTQVVLAQGRSAKDYQEILYSNMEEYEHLAQMIGDMLFLAEADSGLAALDPVNVDLTNELRNLFDYYEAWADERHVTLTLEGHAEVQGDRLMLRRALSNLLSNAIRHTPAEHRVKVTLNPTENGVVIDVRNPGTRIPAEHIGRVFDRFYRVNPSCQRSGEGSGLGLAIAQSIAESHGGKISAHSDQTETQFRIKLPAAKDC